jgi:hypothetical protein
MGDADLRSWLKRGLERHPTPADFSFGESRRTTGTESNGPAIIENDMQTHRRAEVRTQPALYLEAPREAATPLDDIAALVQTLTYGEMMEFSEALWKCRTEAGVTGETLPPLLHRWSANHLASAEGSKYRY